MGKRRIGGANGLQSKCYYCHKRFTTRGSRNRHIRIEHDELKAHKCQYCDCRFKYQYEVQRHEIERHGMAYFHCKYCNKPFKSTDSLGKHCNRMHPQSNNFKWVCIKCNRNCNDRSHYNRHIKTCGSQRATTRASGRQNVTKTIKYKRSIIALIQEKINEGIPEEIAIADVAKQKHIHLSKVKSWWSLRIKHRKLRGTRRNALGSGRPLPKEKQLLFKNAHATFIHERYELQLPFSNADLGDLLVRTANEMEMEYKGIDNQKTLWHDIQLFKKQTQLDMYAISSKKKYDPKYLVPMLGKWYNKVKNYIDKENIQCQNMLFCDETSVRMDFCMKNKTLSTKGRNTPIVTMENSKETFTNCIFWSMNRYVKIFHVDDACLYIISYKLHVCSNF